MPGDGQVDGSGTPMKYQRRRSWTREIDRSGQGLVLRVLGRRPSPVRAARGVDDARWRDRALPRMPTFLLEHPCAFVQSMLESGFGSKVPAPHRPRPAILPMPARHSFCLHPILALGCRRATHAPVRRCATGCVSEADQPPRAMPKRCTADGVLGDPFGSSSHSRARSPLPSLPPSA